jgi:dipeptidyl aminopeptidase/acylaminoacyl peptidase
MFHALTTSTRSLQAAGKTAVFFLEVLPMLPSKPIDWLTATPKVERARYPTSRGEVEGELYRPGGEGPYPGLVVCLGVVPFGVDHPQVPRLGAALARAGFATLLYWSPAMRDLRLDPEDIESIALAYEWLIDRPSIDPGRSGLLGTCVGGSFALMAAAHPAIRDRVSFAVAWAPYASMRTLACDVASATTRAGAVREPWQIDQLTRKVYVRSLTAELEPDEAERLRSTHAERDDVVDAGPLSEEGRAIQPLLTALDVEPARQAVERLPAAMQARLDAMSPVTYLRAIRAPLILLAHDRDDQVIPIGESRRLRAALADRPGVCYTEFTMFKHLDPSKVRLPLAALARELGKFYLTVYPMFRRSVTS